MSMLLTKDFPFDIASSIWATFSTVDIFMLSRVSISWQKYVYKNILTHKQLRLVINSKLYFAGQLPFCNKLLQDSGLLCNDNPNRVRGYIKKRDLCLSKFAPKWPRKLKDKVKYMRDLPFDNRHKKTLELVLRYWSLEEIVTFEPINEADNDRLISSIVGATETINTSLANKDMRVAQKYWAKIKVNTSLCNVCCKSKYSFRNLLAMKDIHGNNVISDSFESNFTKLGPDYGGLLKQLITHFSPPKNILYTGNPYYGTSYWMIKHGYLVNTTIYPDIMNRNAYTSFQRSLFLNLCYNKGLIDKKDLLDLIIKGEWEFGYTTNDVELLKDLVPSFGTKEDFVKEVNLIKGNYSRKAHLIKCDILIKNYPSQ